MYPIGPVSPRETFQNCQGTNLLEPYICIYLILRISKFPTQVSVPLGMQMYGSYSHLILLLLDDEDLLMETKTVGVYHTVLSFTLNVSIY